MTYSINKNQKHKHNNLKFFELISKYLYFIEYLVFFFFGVFYVKISENSETISGSINEHIKLIETKSYFQVFCYCFGFCFLLLFVGLFFAFTLHGKYMLHIIFSYVSLLLGVVCTSLYKAYLFSGFVGVVHYFLPFCIILILCGVLIFEKSGLFSTLILKKLKGEQVDFEFKKFTLFFLTIFLFLILISLVFAVFIKFL